MTTHAMKLVTIVCEAYAKAAVTKLLRDVGALCLLAWLVPRRRGA